MAVSARDQSFIQQQVDTAAPGELASMREEAEHHLNYINGIIGTKILSSEEMASSNYAVEVLTRLDANLAGKGWWYRAKRRMQLTQMYFGS